jgi:hypothetical protein
MNIIDHALSTGALSNPSGAAAAALAVLARRDAGAAHTFASKARTARERIELALAIDSPGTTYAAAREATRKMGVKDPDAALARYYGA